MISKQRAIQQVLKTGYQNNDSGWVEYQNKGSRGHNIASRAKTINFEFGCDCLS